MYMVRTPSRSIQVLCSHFYRLGDPRAHSPLLVYIHVSASVNRPVKSQCVSRKHDKVVKVNYDNCRHGSKNQFRLIYYITIILYRDRFIWSGHIIPVRLSDTWRLHCMRIVPRTEEKRLMLLYLRRAPRDGVCIGAYIFLANIVKLARPTGYN